MENENKPVKSSAFSIASFVLGLISVLTMLFWFLSAITGILSIIFGVKSNKQSGDGLGKAGLVLGIIGLTLTSLIYISMFILILGS